MSDSILKKSYERGPYFSAAEVAPLVELYGELLTAARDLIESSYEHDDRDGRGPNICVNGFDLDELKKAVAKADTTTAPTDGAS